MGEIVEILKNIERNSLLAARSVLDINDTVLFTGYCKDHLYKLVSDRQIPHYKRGNKLYFDKNELEGWMKENRVKTDEEIDREAARKLSKMRWK